MANGTNYRPFKAFTSASDRSITALNVLGEILPLSEFPNPFVDVEPARLRIIRKIVFWVRDGACW
jgi:hypothetical protein